MELHPKESFVVDLGCDMNAIPVFLSSPIPLFLGLLCGGHLIPVCSIQAN